MPYKTNKGLPDRVQKNLPQGAQTIFRKVFNSAYKKYGEIRAFKISWSAVKKSYHKVFRTGKWVKRKK